MPDYLSRLSFGFSHKLPVVLQTEAAECGLACLASVLGFHGFHTDLRHLRARFSLSLKGATLADLVRYAHALNLTPRPLRLELDELANLRLPCILHWDLNHFVVLQSVSHGGITIMNPASGMQKIRMDEVSRRFTGIALELMPNTQFEEKREAKKIRILPMLRGVVGLKRSLFQLLLLAAALQVFALASPFFMQWVIDHAIVSADRDLLLTLALGFGLLMVVQQLVSLVQTWAGMFLATSLNIQWKANVFRRLLDLPVAYFAKRHLGDVVSRFGEVDSIQSTLTSTFFVLVLNSLMAVFTLGLMLLYSVKLSAVVLITLLVYVLIRWAAYYPLRRATEENLVHAAKQSSYFMETVRGIQTVKLFDKTAQRHSTWLNLFVDTVNTGLTSQKLSALFGFANSFLFGVANILIVYWGAVSVLDGAFTVGVLMAFMSYKSQFEGKIGSLIDQFVQIKMLGLHAERLADIVLEETEQGAVGAMQPEKVQGFDFVIENVSFRYAENEPFVLRDVNLQIRQGETVAFAGHSGCGKSTLIQILTGSLKPESGRVLLGGHDIHALPPAFVRQFSATVMQDDVLFAGSIAENICFFDETPDAAKIEHCAKMANIHDEIAAMPMAYETLIGDMGSALSGGQKQRIILARALYREPRILFLDEASSHLDADNERIINDNLRRLNITKIMVAHRQETLAMADRVVVLGQPENSFQAA
ncbi:peptidase domain-containing ABC transporter [Kingella oralis]|jgi:colicin V secretion ABC transporter ATP-binding protein|uniref:peptidase domain-containing ABC transporter n=1 Tax=Kingella oralis TaxID=505 RepID=UPI0028E204AA|nr:peptidase domain-containing ABC transporter [Kingella oralis]